MCEGIVPGEMLHHHVATASPSGLRAMLAPTAAAAAGTSTAETSVGTTARSAATNNMVDDLKMPRDEKQQQEPCFPACMAMDAADSNQRKEVRVIENVPPEAQHTGDEPVVASGRRSRRNSRRMSGDNQREAAPSFDLEDVAQGVLSPVDMRLQAPAPGSIVVDYDEGMPERSRTGLLLREQRDAADCAPDACNPLDALAFDELAIEDMATTSRIAARPRLGSLSQPKTPRTPKTPSRRGKSVVLSGTATALEMDKPALAPVSFSGAAVTIPTPQVVDKPSEESEDAVARCSKLHKLCLCEVRLHKSRESCWLVASGSVYDVTGLVDVHPAGPRSILRKAGGADCTKDMKFHSKAARKMMEKCFIGKLVPCGEDPEEADAPAACTIM